MNSSRASLTLAGALTLLACGHAQVAPAPSPTPQKPAAAVVPAPPPPTEAPPLLQLPTDVQPLHVSLQLAVDPDAERFSGSEEIDVQLDQPRQVIWLHGDKLEVSEASVKSGDEVQPAQFAQVDRTGVVSLTLAHPIGPGKATLHFAWKRGWGENTLGLYRTKEDSRWYAVTQFESIYARRAFPGFDEPRFKTPYDVTLEVPHGQVAVGNAPIASTTTLANGHDQVKFAPTPPLPAYLVAVAVGPWDVVDGPTLPANALRDRAVQTRGLAPKGRGGELAFALKAGAELLAQEEQYFGIAYPYAKLDHIAVPDFQAGAMENAGAITYREDALLYRPGVSPPQQRLGIATDMAHEMAHQWFGDLVTMPWWTDTWLNESFATWMENQAVAEWNPSLGPVRENFLGWLGSAMHDDSLASGRAIRQPLTSTDAIPDQFDSITYAKGAAVLAMFERWMGHEAFQRGIHDYLTAHAWSSGSTDDLLRSLSQAAGKDVAPAVRTFLDQPGIPLVSAEVSCDAGKATLRLSQKRFVRLGSTVHADEQWQIPVCSEVGDATGKTKEVCTLLSGESATVALDACPRWVFPNASASGYYRWALPPAWLARLGGKTLNQLSPIDRVAFAQNLGASLTAGTVPFAEALTDLAPMASDQDPNTATAAMGFLQYARSRLVPEAMRSKVDAYSRRLYGAPASRLGWKPKADETGPQHELRADLLGFLSLTARDPRVRAEATKLGLAYAGLEDGKFHAEAVAPELAGTALATAVEEKGTALFDALDHRLEGLSDSHLRGRVINTLSSTRDPKLAERALALSIDPRLRTNERWIPLWGQLQHDETRERAWSYVKENFAKLLPLISTEGRSQLPMLGGVFCDEPHAKDVEAFFGSHLKEVPGAERTLAQTLEGIRLCTALAKAESPSAISFFSGK